jgi:molecular chaperone GrpE (heat shock protein)
MFARLKRIFAVSPDPATDVETELAARSQIQSLRLQIEERDRTIAQLKAELDGQRSTVRGLAEEAVRARAQRLMQNAAAPAAQLALQAHLLDAEGKPVQARDVLAVARNLVRALEGEGLTVEIKAGERVTFDPNRHEPLSADIPMSAGQPARVKLPALSFQGALLRKAGVVPDGNLA